jgi:RimJ/RimL family protein N-acetyltransferase
MNIILARPAGVCLHGRLSSNVRPHSSHRSRSSLRILETPRLLLRHLELADLPALYSLYRDPEIRQYFPDGTRTLEETKDELEWFLNGHPRHPELGLWATVEKGSGAFLGRCGLLPWSIEGRHEVELAFLIDKARWGQGLATEASLGVAQYARQRLGLRRLTCLITPGNKRSAAVAQKVGMRFEREHTDEFGLCHLHSMQLGSGGA